MKILVINAGSSSLKYELFNGSLKSLAEGIIQRIGEKGQTQNQSAAAKQALAALLEQKIIKSINEITIIGHRVVHGGEKYQKPIRITKTVQKEITKLCNLAPLHNPPNLEGIKACAKLLPKTPQIAVFDTAFHQTLPPKAYIYALPYALYQKNRIRRYGFHGTSHSYVSKETIKLLKKKTSKIITCHLGNGCSIAAVLNGKSIDTSMGLTPLEGIPMGTRCGNIDPAIPLKLAQKMTTKQIDQMLNHESGFKGISGVGSDMRDILKTRKTNKRSQLAIDIFTYKTAQQIAAYTASLKGLTAITFTGGIGENSGYIRKEICNYLTHFGIKLDPQNNNANAITISSPSSKIKVFAIKTDEEKEIALQTIAFAKPPIA